MRTEAERIEAERRAAHRDLNMMPPAGRAELDRRVAAIRAAVEAQQQREEAFRAWVLGRGPHPDPRIRDVLDEIAADRAAAAPAAGPPPKPQRPVHQRPNLVGRAALLTVRRSIDHAAEADRLARIRGRAPLVPSALRTG